MKKTTHCSECKKLTECTMIMGEYLCKQCIEEMEDEDDSGDSWAFPGMLPDEF